MIFDERTTGGDSASRVANVFYYIGGHEGPVEHSTHSVVYAVVVSVALEAESWEKQRRPLQKAAPKTRRMAPSMVEMWTLRSSKSYVKANFLRLTVLEKT